MAESWQHSTTGTRGPGTMVVSIAPRSFTEPQQQVIESRRRKLKDALTPNHWPDGAGRCAVHAVLPGTMLTVLANLLPGVRELRTPLVTGYLYIAAVWIWVGSAWVSGASENTALRHLREMADQVGPAGVAIAAGFLSYLLGSLLTVGTPAWIEVIAGLPEWVIWALYRRKKRFHNILRERIWPSSLSQRFDLQRRISNLDRGRRPFERDTSRMDGWIQEQVGDLSRRGWTARRILASQRVPDGIARWASDIYEHQGIGAADGDPIRRDEDYAVTRAVERAFGQVIGAEREVVLIRMQIEREALYDGYQRLVSESELRTSIFVPLSLCIAGLAWFWNPLFALLLFGPWVLARRGLVLANEAEERVTQALTTGVVQSPTVKSMFDMGPYDAAEGTGSSNGRIGTMVRRMRRDERD